MVRSMLPICLHMLTGRREAQGPQLERTYGERVLAHAARRFVVEKSSGEPAETSQLLRGFIKVEERRLRMAPHAGVMGHRMAVARSFVLDQAVSYAIRAATDWAASGGYLSGAENCWALVALGGYGRGELAPYSDLDILMLHEGHRATQVRILSERILQVLWDAGLTVGHSLRTVSDCITATHGDPHLQTALLSARLLAGDEGLFDSLSESFDRDRRKRAETILATIVRERDLRYVKFGSAVGVQEPNLKEGAGGLRDFHTGLWAAHVKFECRTLEEFEARGHISRDEQRALARAYDFIWRLRNALHLQSRRKTERLALDPQAVLAREFGYQPDAYLLGSEKLMRDYYRHARVLNEFSESALARASERGRKSVTWWGRTRSAPSDTDPVSIRDGRLHLDGGAEVFTDNPLRLFDALTLAQAAGAPPGHSLRQAMRASLTAIDHKFRSSEEAADAFLRLLRRRGRVGQTLRLMHELGFLGRYLPEFGRISLLAQHDLYHHYTVDEHTLRAIEALDELHTDQNKHHTHLRIVSDEIEDVALLYLSILLHDIGKGRGAGHIERGAKIAERVCRRLHLRDEARAKVVLMVRQHVAMAQLAQRRDLNEPQVAAGFAAQMGTLEALNMLLLLTYADLNAVGPGVWSEWKGNLLWELYRRTRTLMTGTDAPPDEAEKLARFKEQVVRSLHGALPLSAIERHLALLPDRYLRVTTPDAAATHLTLIGELEGGVYACRWLRHGRASTRLTICAWDRHGLFADIAGTLTAHGVEILNAEINTREDGIALDVLMLREAATHHALDAERYESIEKGLRKAIARESDVPALVERWRTQHAPRRAVRTLQTRRRKLPHVACDNEASEASTLIEVQAPDEPGLAYNIASLLATLGLDIVCAKIATEKSDALDVFYVTDLQGRKLSTTVSQSVETSLAERLSLAGSAAKSALTIRKSGESR